MITEACRPRNIRDDRSHSHANRITMLNYSYKPMPASDTKVHKLPNERPRAIVLVRRDCDPRAAPIDPLYASPSASFRLFTTFSKIAVATTGATAFPICFFTSLSPNLWPNGKLCKHASSLGVQSLLPLGWMLPRPLPLPPVVMQ